MSWLDDLRSMLGGLQQPLQSAVSPIQPAVQQLAQGDVRGALGALQQPLQDLAPNSAEALRRTGAGLMSGAGTVGDVLSTPASIGRGSGVTLGNLLRGDTGAAQEAAQRTFRGILDPEQRISGQEAVGGNSIVSDIATDPLAMAGLAHIGERAGTSLLSRLSPQAARTMAPEAARTGQILRGGQNLSTYATDAAGNTTVTAPTGGPTGRLYGTNDIPRSELSDFQQWTGRGMPTTRSSLQEILSPSGQSAAGGSTRDLLPLRRQFTVARDVGLDWEGNPTAGRLVGGMNALEPGQTDIARLGQVSDAVRSQLPDIAMGRANGSYNIPGRTAVLPSDATGMTVTPRHEILHGIYQTAANNNALNNLRLIPRLSMQGQLSESPLLQGLGLMGEEASTHAGGAGRGFFPQVQEMGRFLRQPIQGYLDQINSVSPLAADIYGSAAIPRLGMAGYGAGAAGTAALLQNLTGGQ